MNKHKKNVLHFWGVGEWESSIAARVGLVEMLVDLKWGKIENE